MIPGAFASTGAGAAGLWMAKLHEVLRRTGDEVAASGIPRTNPAVAAVRAAHWAVSDRQAALVLAMPVQQRIITGEQLVDATRKVRGRTRRRLIPLLARDIADQFRQNAVVIRGDRVLRMTLVGLRLGPDAFRDQVCEAYHRFRRP